MLNSETPKQHSVSKLVISVRLRHSLVTLILLAFHKVQSFRKNNESKLSFSFLQEKFRSYRFVKLGDTEATLESKLVKSVRPRHSLVTPRLIGFH